MAGRDDTHPSGETLSAHVDGELDAETARLVARHLRTCRRCRATVAAYRATGAAIKRLPRQPVPPALLHDLAQSIDRHDKPDALEE